MKTGKHDEILDRIDSLPNWQVFLCCRTLVILLDRELTNAGARLRPEKLMIADLRHFPRQMNAFSVI